MFEPPINDDLLKAREKDDLFVRILVSPFQAREACPFPGIPYR
jgi:hypothetical protein